MALENGAYTRALRGFAGRVRRPPAILVVSAHWEAPLPIRVNAVAHPSLIYDFGGFPAPLYRLTYPAPGAPELAAEVADGLVRAGREAAPDAPLAVSTTEHFDPLFIALGARSPDDRVVPVYEGFHYGTLSMRCFALEGAP